MFFGGHDFCFQRRKNIKINDVTHFVTDRKKCVTKKRYYNWVLTKFCYTCNGCYGFSKKSFPRERFFFFVFVGVDALLGLCTYPRRLFYLHNERLVLVLLRNIRYIFDFIEKKVNFWKILLRIIRNIVASIRFFHGFGGYFRLFSARFTPQFFSFSLLKSTMLRIIFAILIYPPLKKAPWGVISKNRVIGPRSPFIHP